MHCAQRRNCENGGLHSSALGWKICCPLEAISSIRLIPVAVIFRNPQKLFLLDFQASVNLLLLSAPLPTVLPASSSIQAAGVPAAFVAFILSQTSWSMFTSEPSGFFLRVLLPKTSLLLFSSRDCSVRATR